MPPARIVEALDELEDGHARFGLRLEATPIEQLTFERGEETLRHRVVVGISDRPPELQDELNSLRRELSEVASAIAFPEETVSAELGRRDTTHCAQRSAAKETKTTYHKLCGKRYLLLVYSVLALCMFCTTYLDYCV